jgi:Mg2+ and Co2+ transporter CorA
VPTNASQHFRTIETDKDNQEKASLAFTTVTVLFLPLTLLASIFGMNTNDIRNMQQSQGLFWGIAVPMCAGALLIWLMYLGTLGRWYKRLRRVPHAR